MASLAFTGCELVASSARAKARSKKTARRPDLRVAGHRRQVMVGGKRAKVIDVHAHCVIPEAYALLGLKVDDHRGPGIAEVGQRRISEMDAQGIDMEAISINPAW